MYTSITSFWIDNCVPYSQEACEAVAKELGIQLGTEKYAFAKDTYTDGCYAYKSGTYENTMWYGTGATEEQMKTELTLPKYRPPGYDCKGNM